jgi:hypothetical protein
MSEPSADYDCTDASNTEAPKAMTTSSGGTARHIELTQRTNELLSDYGNFLNELGNGFAHSDGGDDGEFGQSTALQTPRSSIHSSDTDRANNLSLKGFYDDEDVSYNPSNPNETNLWNRREYYDYDADRKKLYRYRMFRTKNNMVYMCGLGVVLALVVIAGISISKSKGQENRTPTTATVLREEDAPKSVKDLLANIDTSYMPTDPNLKELYLAATAMFQPVWYDRSTWKGQAYLAAYQFCNSQNDKMQPCPYMAICPAGAGNVPLGGAKKASGGNVAWVPIKNEPNEWVQVSLSDGKQGEICQLYSTTHGDAPHWGLTGEDNEELTQNIVCCLIDEEIMLEEPEVFTNIVDEANEDFGSDLLDRPPSLEEDEVNDIGGMKMDSDISQEVIANTVTGHQTSLPKDTDIPAYWYSRSDDWQGTTYAEAVQFCSSQNDKSICPYQLYCPNGPGGTPYGSPYEGALQSLLESDSLFWSPVLNNAGEEAWAGVGKTNQCVPPLDRPRASPDMLFDATSFIMCCDMAYGHTKPSSQNQQNDSDAEVSDNVITEPSQDEFLQAVKDVWDPVWFSTSDGWNGGSYIEALDFCRNNLPTGELCPYQAICPNNIEANPYKSEEVTALAKDQWVPAREGALSYILVSRAQSGSGPGEICNSYESIYGESPSFGTNNESNDQKQYLLCCHHYDEQGDDDRNA